MVEARDRPMVPFDDQLRAHRRRRQKLYRCYALIGAGIIAVLATIASPPLPRFLWNVSESAPVGLYLVEPGNVHQPSEMVIARVPEPYRGLAAQRHYLPANVPLVKRIAAGPGDRTCARDVRIFVNGKPVARRRMFDGRGRPMPWWSGCEMLRSGKFLLLMEAPDSFDGRYFGPVDETAIVGKATPLWVH